MPRGELAPQENPDLPPQSTTKEEQLEAIDLAVEKTTDAFLETQDTEGPPPLPEEFLAAYEAEQRAKQEAQEEQDFLNRDPNVIRARADYNRVDAEMLALGITMTESPDANKRAQAKRKYEKMCGIGLNNPKNGEFNLAVAAMHRAEDRSAAQFEAMKKAQEAQGVQSALDKKTNDISAIESQLGTEAVPVAELKQVADLMRDAVAANIDAEIAREKVVAIPDFVFSTEPQRAFEANILAPDARFDQARSEMVTSYIQDANSLSVPDAQKTNTEFLFGLQQKGSELEQIAATLRAEMMKSPDTQAKKDNLLALDNLDKVLIRKMDYINTLVGPLAYETKGNVDKKTTLAAAQKVVGELRRTAAMGFMVPYESRNDVKYLKGKYNEAMSFTDKISAYKNSVEGQNLSDAQKMEVYQAIDGVQDELDRHLSSIDEAVKEAEKNDFHEQSLSSTPTGERLVRTAVGLNRGLSQEQDRYAASDWMPTAENYEPAAVQKPKKGFFGSFGAKVVGGLASLAAAFTFGSSRAPERTVTPNFTQPEKVNTDTRRNAPLHFVDNVSDRGTEAVTALPDINIRVRNQAAAPRQVERVHPDHPMVQRTMEKIDNEIVPATVVAPGSETERRVDEEVKKAMAPIDAAINSATPGVPKIFSAETGGDLGAQNKKEDPLSILPNVDTVIIDPDLVSPLEQPLEQPALQENIVEPTKDLGENKQEVQGENSDIDEEEGGTAEVDAMKKTKKGKLPGYLEKPLQELGEDITRSMKQIDRDNDRFAAKTQKYLNKKTTPFKSSAKAKSKGKSGKVSKPLTSEQKAEVQVAANEALKSVDKILNEESKPGLNLFGGEAGPSKITDLSTAKREWQMAFENVQLAKDTGQPLEIVAELQKDLDAAHDTYERLANPGAYTSKERRSALSLGELALSGDLSRVDNKMLDARMAALIKQESAFNDKFAQATFDAQQKGGALAVAEISEKDRKALAGVVGERARIQAEMVRRAGGTKSSSDTSRGTVMSGGVDLAPGTAENGGYTSTERGSDTEMSGGVILAPGTTEIKKPNLDRENERYNELLRDLNSIEKSDGKNTLEYKRAQKALDDFLGDLKD